MIDEKKSGNGTLATKRQWTPLRFSKHRDQTLPVAILHDPDWFFWAIEEDAFHRDQPGIVPEAEELDQKARSIKLPKEGWLVEYLEHPGVKKLAALYPVPASHPIHQGSSPAFRRNVIDLSIARQLAPYDKTGAKLLLEAVRRVYFRGRNMTQDRCEAFFEDDSHFDL